MYGLILYSLDNKVMSMNKIQKCIAKARASISDFVRVAVKN